MRQDSAYQFIDLSPESNGNPADSFVLRRMWQFGDGASSTDKSPLHHYANDGEYNVKLVVFNPSGCSDSIEKRIDYKLGIKNSSLSSNLIVSPNPFRNYVELRFNMEKPAEYRIRLVNSTGIQVLNWQTYSLTQGINTIRLNTSNLPYGTYLLQITDGISSAATTIIKNE
jgi:PKD repeat protein